MSRKETGSGQSSQAPPPFWIGVCYFLIAAAPGAWYPVLSNVLTEAGLAHLVTYVFMIPPLSVVIAPLLFAAKVDQSYPAERVLAVAIGGGAVFLFLAFEVLSRGWHPGWFMALLLANALISAPIWSLLNTVAFANLAEPEKHFGKFRVWGTIGWLVAGVAVSLLALDTSAWAGKLGAFVRVLGCLA